LEAEVQVGASKNWRLKRGGRPERARRPECK